MGAWGLGLFESDHDFDCIGDMYKPAGLEAVEAKFKERAKSSATDRGDQCNNEGEDEDDDFPQLSVHAAQCADVSLVRDHLDSGALQKFVDQKKAEIDEKSKVSEPIDAFSHAWAVYELVLFGACAMSLGCKIPADFKELLIATYRTTELQRDALGQMQVALGDGPDRYKEGIPYEFVGLRALPSDSNREDRLYPDSMLMNVSAPFGLLRNPTPAPKREYPACVCGGCGADKRLDNEPLLCCDQCNMRKYCSKVCQQAHFEQHKEVCDRQ